jgi:Rad3-related DNA helicase
MEGVRASGINRTLITYTEGAGREDALGKYKRMPGAVMFAPSMQRGVDLPGDLCRVQVIAKVPFPALGDRQVSARTHLPGGQTWYNVQAIRDVVQMAGRGVRSKDDHAVTYILDRQFGRNLWGKNKSMFPAWFNEAIDTKSDIRWMKETASL